MRRKGVFTGFWRKMSSFEQHNVLFYVRHENMAAIIISLYFIKRGNEKRILELLGFII